MKAPATIRSPCGRIFTRERAASVWRRGLAIIQMLKPRLNGGGCSMPMSCTLEASFSISLLIFGLISLVINLPEIFQSGISIAVDLGSRLGDCIIDSHPDSFRQPGQLVDHIDG